jgi:phospholipid/cholesterol/gamma-HCH transport system substrate-binding protein
MKVYGSLIKLVAFMVITTFCTLVLAATISNGGISDTVSYHARFADATGLNKGDDVRVAGVRVGQVKSIKLVNKRYADVDFAVRKDIELRSTAEASIRYLNLVGQRYLAVSEGSSIGTPLQTGGLIPLSQTTPPLDLTVLFNGFRPLFRALSPGEVNQLSYEIIQVLQGEGGTIESLLTHTASLTSTLADRDRIVGSVITNLDDVLSTVDQRNSGLSELLLQMQRLVAGLSGDRGSISNSITSINSLTGSTASLLRDVRPALKTDIAQLGNVTKTLAKTTEPNGANTLDTVLQRLPGKVKAILRTATYGSWFNFYLCNFQVEGVPVSGHSGVPSCDQS